MTVIPDGLEPAGVWDCNDPGSAYWSCGWRETAAWAQEHIRRANDTVRAEFYLLDMPLAVLYRVALNENGKLFADPGTGGVAMEGPAVQVLGELPPARLLRPAV